MLLYGVKNLAITSVCRYWNYEWHCGTATIYQCSAVLILSDIDTSWNHIGIIKIVSTVGDGSRGRNSASNEYSLDKEVAETVIIALWDGRVD